MSFANDNDTMSEMSENERGNTYYGEKYVQNMFAMDPMSQRYIISAVTGQRIHCQITAQPIKQNSLASRQLFAVMDCTAFDGSKDPMKLYYDTPEQYERHRRVKVPRDRKELWRKKITDLGYSAYGVNNVETVSKSEVTVVK
tara:strand:+ start:832 stop:1257 length:426 start_codon:yes stop_codon:yes gene_type:complete